MKNSINNKANNKAKNKMILPLVATLSVLFAQSAMAAGMPRDILPEQEDIYTVSPGGGGGGSSSPGSVATNGLKVSIWVDQQDITYYPGEDIVISAKANRDAYLTIIDVGTSGTVRQLFPNKHQTDNFVRRGQIIQIPGRHAGYTYRVQGPAGTELIKAIVTSKPVNIYGKSANTFQPEGPFSKSTQPAATLSKDIVVELDQQDPGAWAHYNKVIYIKGNHHPGVNQPGEQPVQGDAQSAYQAERALHLTYSQIRAIQKTLRSKGYYHGRIDGIIGKGTRRAIRQWQRNAGLRVTGYIDRETFNRLI